MLGAEILLGLDHRNFLGNYGDTGVVYECCDDDHSIEFFSSALESNVSELVAMKA